MAERRLVIVKSPDAYLSAEGTFVVNEFLFTGLLKTVGYRLDSTDVSYEDALHLVSAIKQIPRTTQTEIGWALCGDPGSGVDALVDFLAGGSFEIVDGETVRPEDVP
jgi:hypothetical protein